MAARTWGLTQENAPPEPLAAADHTDHAAFKHGLDGHATEQDAGDYPGQEHLAEETGEPTNPTEEEKHDEQVHGRLLSEREEVLLVPPGHEPHGENCRPADDADHADLGDERVIADPELEGDEPHDGVKAHPQGALTHVAHPQDGPAPAAAGDEPAVQVWLHVVLVQLGAVVAANEACHAEHVGHGEPNLGVGREIRQVVGQPDAGVDGDGDCTHDRAGKPAGEPRVLPAADSHNQHPEHIVGDQRGRDHRYDGAQAEPQAASDGQNDQDSQRKKKVHGFSVSAHFKAGGWLLEVFVDCSTQQ